MSSPVDDQLRQYVVGHIASRLQAVRAETVPFPHFVMPEFFPQDVYANLLSWLPAVEAYESFAYEKHADQNGQSNRQRFRLENSWLDRLEQPQRRFWYTLRGALGSTEVKRAVFTKLQAGLAFRFSCDPSQAADLPGFALPELFRETDGYQIKPHPDTRKKVVTMQIALPRDNSQKDLGTEFYRRSFSAAAWFREPRGFETVKTMPFLPNTAYAFAVINAVRLKSWHGRSVLPTGGGVRNSMLNIWYAKAEHGNPDLVQEQQTPASRREVDVKVRGKRMPHDAKAGATVACVKASPDSHKEHQEHKESLTTLCSW